MTILRRIMAVNAASNLGFGGLFLFAPGAVAAFLGSAPPLVIAVLGAVLLGNGAHLVVAMRRARLRWGEVAWFSAGDMAWWTGSMALLAAQVWATTPAGTFAVWAVALGVAAMGLGQLFALGRHLAGLDARALWRQIGGSWWALPLWVRLWLVALNAVFLAALAFAPSDLSRVTLIAWVAVGPLGAGMVFAMGGLNRLLGVAHMVPWLPLLGWLVIARPEPLGYTATLATMLAVCLAFDVVDALRWLRGDRAVPGTAAA